MSAAKIAARRRVVIWRPFPERHRRHGQSYSRTPGRALGRRRQDVLIQSEQVLWIVTSLDHGQAPILVSPIGSKDAIRTFIGLCSKVVDIDHIGSMARCFLENAPGPVAVSVIVGRALPARHDEEIVVRIAKTYSRLLAADVPDRSSHALEHQRRVR